MADGILVWFPVITALAGIGGALGSQYVSHRLALHREEATAARKREAELYFISTELVFILERFAQRCVLSALESGEYDESGRIKIQNFLPEINYTSVAGDWRALPPQMMYRLSELPVIREESARSISSELNEDDYDGSDGLYELNNQSARLGLKSIRLSRSLRRLCGMPEDELSKNSSSAWRMLWLVRGHSIKQKLDQARNTRTFNELVRIATQDNPHE